jgi:enterochelin esterase-like enzyme
MKRRYNISILTILTGLIFTINTTAQTRRTIVSPEIHPDKTVTFRFMAPEANKVELSAQFLAANQIMVKDTSGLWSVTVGPITPDIYPYCFVADGKQVADPNNVDIFPNERFKNSLVDIPGEQPLIHAIQNVPHGKISYKYYKSNTLDLVRRLVIYTPPGYKKSDAKKYPVLYLIHGMTDTEETWFKVGRTNFILDNLIAQGKAEPMIIVMPYANPYPDLQKKNKNVEADFLATDHFTNELLKEIIPFVESNYNAIDDNKSRAIAGFSLGGRQTLAAGLGHPDVFGYVCAFAPAIFDGELDNNFKNVYASSEKIKENLNLLWVSCGKEDGLYNISLEFLKKLDEKEIKYESLFSPGGHTWMNCRLYLSTISPKLFK